MGSAKGRDKGRTYSVVIKNPGLLMKVKSYNFAQSMLNPS